MGGVRAKPLETALSAETAGAANRNNKGTTSGKRKGFIGICICDTLLPDLHGWRKCSTRGITRSKSFRWLLSCFDKLTSASLNAGQEQRKGALMQIWRLPLFSWVHSVMGCSEAKLRLGSLSRLAMWVPCFMRERRPLILRAAHTPCRAAARICG